MDQSTEQRRRARRIIRTLQRDYPDARCALSYSTPLELLVATILSAQCTDERVNAVTPELFRRFRTAKDFAEVPQAVLERAIRSTGFFRNKAKNIRACCQRLADEFGGDVPREMESLVALPGIGRKTANVVLGTAFGIASGIVVDTHVARVSRRLGLTRQSDPNKIERELMQLVPRKEWVDFSHRVIQHGRRICTARKPRCASCSLCPNCPRIGVETVVEVARR